MPIPPPPAPGEHLAFALHDRHDVDLQLDPLAHPEAWHPGVLTAVRTTSGGHVTATVEYRGPDGLRHLGTFSARQVREAVVGRARRSDRFLRWT